MNINNTLQRTGHISFVHDGCLYIWGGYKESEDDLNQSYWPGSELAEYDPLFEKWIYHKCIGSVPPGTSGSAAVKVDNNVYLFGGFREDGNTNDLFCLNLKTLTWRLIAMNGSPPIPCDKHVGWAHKDRLFFFGGFGLEPCPRLKRPLDFSYVLDNHTPYAYGGGWNNQLMCFDTVSEKWSVPMYKGTAPVARAAHACAKIQNKVFIMGGRHQETRMNDIHSFDTETLEWSGPLIILDPQPVHRSWHSLTALTDCLLLLYGGFSQDNVPLSDGWLLNLSSLTWMQLECPLNRPRLWHTASLMSPGEVFICGGCSENILSPDPTHDDNADVIVLRFTPKTMLRLCFDRIVELQALLRKDWVTLPNNMQHILNTRVGRDISTQARPLGGS